MRKSVPARWAAFLLCYVDLKVLGIVSFGIVHGHGWLKVCTSENWTDNSQNRRGRIVQYICSCFAISAPQILRISNIPLEHTPDMKEFLFI